MKLKLKNFENFFLKKQSLDKEYIILIQNYEFLSLFVLKILVSVACVICTFNLHPLDLIELRLTDEKNIIVPNYFKFYIKNQPENGERSIFRWTIYYEKKYY